MRANKVIACLLLSYWLFVGFVNLVFIESFGSSGFIELILYSAIGIACYFVASKIGDMVSRHRKPKDNRQITRWW